MSEVHRFGEIVIDTVQRRVQVRGQAVALGARAFDVLLALIGRPGRVLSKNELLDIAWPGLVVEEANVQVQVSSLRAVLGREAIATVPGLGYRWALASDEPALAGTSVQIGEAAQLPRHLPAIHDELLGREDDCASLASSLATQRLVTITGPGGIGKTRVALAVAHALTDRFADGVCWVDLAALVSADQLASTVAAAMGLQLGRGDVDVSLGRMLHRYELLLVLDNCEHLAGVVARLVRCCLDSAPQLRVLATSQVPLKLGTEQCFRLDPLALPTAGASAQEMRSAPALALLLRRAQAIDRRFDIDAQRLDMAASICRQLDGVPLALELAAARLPTLGVAALLDMLDQRLSLLSHARADLPPRQRALQAALDWSCALLSQPELSALQQLSIFPASFRLDSALKVLGGDGAAAIEALASLVEKCLVQVEQREPPRYRLLESTRLHAAQGFQQSGDADATRLRWRSAITQLADECERNFWVMTDSQWIAGYQHDHANLVSAFDECVSAKDLAGAGAAGEALHRWDFLQNINSAIPRRKQAALTLLAGADEAQDSAACAELWNVASSFAEIQLADTDRTGLAQRRLAAWRRRNEPRQIYRALGSLAGRHAARGDSATAMLLLAEADAIAQSQWPCRLLATGAFQAALVQMLIGDAQAYKRAAQASLELSMQAGATQNAARARTALADACAMAGEYPRAIGMLRAAVKDSRRLRQPVNETVALAMLCAALLLSGDTRQARDTAAQAWPLALEHGLAASLLDPGILIAVRTGQHELATRLLRFAQRDSRATRPARWFNEARLLEMAKAHLTMGLGGEPMAVEADQGLPPEDKAGFDLLGSILLPAHSSSSHS